MKGVSEFVLILLILIIAIESLLFVWLFYNSMFGSVTTEDTSNLGEALSSCMKIDSARNNKIYLRNCGTGVVRNGSTSVYMDEAPLAFTMNPSSIGKGQVAEIGISNLWGMSLGNHKIRISSKAGEVERYVKAVLPDSCVLALDFDEGSGTIVYDSSANGNDGTLLPVGSLPQWVDGKFGKALQFDGINDYVEVPDSNSLDLRNELTIELWANSQDWIVGGSGWRPFVDKLETYVFEKSFYPSATNGALAFHLWSGGSRVGNWDSHLSNSLTWEFGKWYHFLMGYNKSYVKFYRDGQYIGGVAETAQIDVTNNNITIGKGPTGPGWEGYVEWFNGTIDSVRIYNKALTPDETISLTLGELT